jgi:hypothetical protein
MRADEFDLRGEYAIILGRVTNAHSGCYARRPVTDGEGSGEEAPA